MILAIGFLVVKNMPNNKNVFLTSITNGYKQLGNVLKTSGQENIYNNLLKQGYQIKSDTTFHLEVHSQLEEELKQIIDELNHLAFHSDITVDGTKKLLNAKFNATYKEQDIIKTNIYGQNNSLYVHLVNILDEYIEIPIENYQELFNQNITEVENISYLIEKVGNSFVNAIDEKDFKETKEKIQINGKEISANKISYIINEQKAYETC